MNILCPNSTPCLGDPVAPYANFSSEAPDQNISIGEYWGNPQFLPPAGSDWQSWSCYGKCNSTISQADADQCAANAQLECLLSSGGPGGTSGDAGSPPTKNGTPILTYQSHEITGFAPCPDGSLSSFTLPAGYVVASSQALADQIAQSLANSFAILNRVCLSDLPTIGCVGTNAAETLNASGRYAPFTFAVTAGNLPPDTSLIQIDGTTALLVGTLTTPGTFTYTITATDSNQDATPRTYTTVIVGITPSSPLPDGTVGSAYSQQLAVTNGLTAPLLWSIFDGALPDGLSLDPNAGIISGTPTGLPAGFEFTVQVADANGNACQQDYTLTIDVPGFGWSTLAFGPIIVNSDAPTGTATGGLINVVCTGPSFGVTPAGDWFGTLVYNGPAVAVNLNVNGTASGFGNCVIDITDPNGPGQTGGFNSSDLPPPGGQNLPFTIGDTMGVPATITVEVQWNGAFFGGDGAVNATFTLT